MLLDKRYVTKYITLSAWPRRDNAMGDLTSNRRDLFWPCVAAFGALWGMLEITLGAFLHALRIPFSGALMASAGAALLVAQRQMMPRRGAAIATGAVAALCKTLSPGGAIIGPMGAIFMEAALVEVALLLFSRSVLSAALAGALAATWAVSQKVLVQVLLYGTPIIELYLEAMKKGADWLGVSRDAPFDVLAAFLGLIAALGAIAGLFGRSVGMEAQRQLHASVATGKNR